jgi:hypothetical protein
MAFGTPDLNAKKFQQIVAETDLLKSKRGHALGMSALIKNGPEDGKGNIAARG